MILSWLNKNIDKVAHESLCNLIAWIVFLPSFIIIKYWAVIPAFIIAFIVGYFKEKKDFKFDRLDIEANCIGIIRFGLQILLVYLIL